MTPDIFYRDSNTHSCISFNYSFDLFFDVNSSFPGSTSLEMVVGGEYFEAIAKGNTDERNQICMKYKHRSNTFPDLQTRARHSQTKLFCSNFF